MIFLYFSSLSMGGTNALGANDLSIPPSLMILARETAVIGLWRVEDGRRDERSGMKAAGLPRSGVFTSGVGVMGGLCCCWGNGCCVWLF